MKLKIDNYKLKILIIIILAIILTVMVFIYVRNMNSGMGATNSFKTDVQEIEITQQSEDNTENTTSSTSSNTTISASTQVSSALTENIELHATYYLEELIAEENTIIEEGENILEYTNGTYLTAPYDCIIVETNIPEEGEMCTNAHYIQISSVKSMQVSFSVDESLIDDIAIGDEVTIEVSALDVEVTGYVTKISSTATQGAFTVTAEFENNQDIKIGMTAEVTI